MLLCRYLENVACAILRGWTTPPLCVLRTASFLACELRTNLFWHCVLRTVKRQKQPFVVFLFINKKIKMQSVNVCKRYNMILCTAYRPFASCVPSCYPPWILRTEGAGVHPNLNRAVKKHYRPTLFKKEQNGRMHNWNKDHAFCFFSRKS